MKNIHFITTCTAQKSVKPSIKQCLNNYQDNNYLDWLTQLGPYRKEEATVSVDELYTGQSFKIAKKTCEALNIEMHVLSAGFGLLDFKQRIPPYNASFSPSKDKVPSPSNQWWKKITTNEYFNFSRSVKDLFKEHPNDIFIICCGREYLFAIKDDLHDAITSLSDTKKQLIVICSDISKMSAAIESNCIKSDSRFKNVPQQIFNNNSITDRTLTTHVGCVVMKKLVDGSTVNSIINELNELVKDVAPPTKPKRQQQSDEFILNFIERALKDTPNIGCASLLKQYQSQGNACQDTRFRALFKQVVK